MKGTLRGVFGPGLFGLACAACGLAALAQRPGPDRPRAAASAAYLEELDPAVTWSGPWSTNPLPANSGGSARLAMDAGAEARLEFEGTSVSWIGYRDEWSGIANVLLDGTPQAAVDTYATPARAQSVLYAATGLHRGTHVLVIQATGTRSPASGGSWIWVDAFSIGQARAPVFDPAPVLLPSRRLPPASRWATTASRPARASPGARLSEEARLEQDDPAVRWSGAWSTNHLELHSGGSARLAMEPTARVSFTFVGTGVSWVGYRDEWSGIAEVRLDGRLVGAVDTYSKPARPRAALYAVDGLRPGRHTLTIQPTGRRRPASGGSWIWVDAFAVGPWSKAPREEEP